MFLFVYLSIYMSVYLFIYILPYPLDILIVARSCSVSEFSHQPARRER